MAAYGLSLVAEIQSIKLHTHMLQLYTHMLQLHTHICTHLVLHNLDVVLYGILNTYIGWSQAARSFTKEVMCLELVM